MSSTKVVRIFLRLRVELYDGERIVARATETLAAAPVSPVMLLSDAGQAQGAQPFAQTDKPAHTVTLSNLKEIELWDLQKPKLYTVLVTLLEDGSEVDSMTRRVGFREAKFTDHGFSLNGKVIKLHGLDHHQTFPWVGQAMPARVQRQDAKILRHDSHCNIVRTSHYSQSPHFLDACDEFGLLVLEEIPGWQHTGDKAWQDIAVDNVRRMMTNELELSWQLLAGEGRSEHSSLDVIR